MVPYKTPTSGGAIGEVQCTAIAPKSLIFMRRYEDMDFPRHVVS